MIGKASRQAVASREASTSTRDAVETAIDASKEPGTWLARLRKVSRGISRWSLERPVKRATPRKAET